MKFKFGYNFPIIIIIINVIAITYYLVIPQKAVENAVAPGGGLNTKHLKVESMHKKAYAIKEFLNYLKEDVTVDLAIDPNIRTFSLKRLIKDIESVMSEYLYNYNI